MKKVVVIFPHQLFEIHPAFDWEVDQYVLVEEYLFFRQYSFHKNKLVYHRATMKMYADYLATKGKHVLYVDSDQRKNPPGKSDIRSLIPWLAVQGYQHFITTKLADQWLEKRWEAAIQKCQGQSTILESPMFLNTRKERQSYLAGKKALHQTDFYSYQRKKRNILLGADGKPQGGKWTFDTDNRKKYPRDKTVPPIRFAQANHLLTEAMDHVEKHFPNNPGQVSGFFLYPVTFDDAKHHLRAFLENRMYAFGDYEDAIVRDEVILHHSVLTPMLNTGLLTPAYIIEKTLEYHETVEKIPLNSLEGFIRQILGWREFIALVYEEKGVQQRTANFWNHRRKIPRSFYDGTTGITPVDQTIRKVMATGYCHHIERLMILGNFMLLCEFDPDEVYRWFMELFIDAYDWVMVPNIYGMSQFADGGIFATKPYISGSNYILKMSNYTPGPWTKIWDALFWDFLDQKRDYFRKNPRLSMLLRNLDRMDSGRKKEIRETSDLFLSTMDQDS